MRVFLIKEGINSTMTFVFDQIEASTESRIKDSMLDHAMNIFISTQ